METMFEKARRVFLALMQWKWICRGLVLIYAVIAMLRGDAEMMARAVGYAFGLL
ncbi:hypothetical protein [Antarctobacter jejuensis]|uniref:hypothetical protein n=1 Tax=Antarctobacter jejuensis TaxID=1439938 RepID=UPI003FD1DF6E